MTDKEIAARWARLTKAALDVQQKGRNATTTLASVFGEGKPDAPYLGATSEEKLAWLQAAKSIGEHAVAAYELAAASADIATMVVEQTALIEAIEKAGTNTLPN